MMILCKGGTQYLMAHEADDGQVIMSFSSYPLGAQMSVSIDDAASFAALILEVVASLKEKSSK